MLLNMHFTKLNGFVVEHYGYLHRYLGSLFMDALTCEICHAHVLIAQE